MSVSYTEPSPMKVKMRRAEIIWSSSTFGFAEGIRVWVEVENLGYDKEVAIHYWNRKERKMSYRQSLNDNREEWYWESGYSDSERLGKSCSAIKFAIRYTVNGETYWDNNGGWDYCLQRNQPVAPAIWTWPSSLERLSE